MATSCQFRIINMNRKTLLEKVGNIQQVAHIRTSRMSEGRSNNMRMATVKNDDLSYQIMLDKCLDISQLEYKGININFLSKPGLNGRNSFDTNGAEALRSIMGGMFFTCGFENICAPYVKGDTQYPMHGRMRTTPAENVCTDCYWVDDETYQMSVSGEMVEAQLFGEHLSLRRKITTSLGVPKINICDEIINQTCRVEPIMLLYHCNFGYPFLSDKCELIIPAIKTVGREDYSQSNIKNWDKVSSPKDGVEEEVFIHSLKADENGMTFVGIFNQELGFGVRINFNIIDLPYFMEWKSMASNDYVIGFEPSNSSVYGRALHEVEGNIPFIAPYEKKIISWSFEIIKDENEKDRLIDKIKDFTNKEE